jgi:pre-mRNA-processing factor 40
VTTWDKPDELKSAEEKALASSATGWQEFTTAAGKKYFYNSKTKQTTWTVPDELASPTKSSSQAAGGTGVAATAAPAAAAATPPKQQQQEAAEVVVSQEKRQFLAMIEAAGVGAGMAWEEAMRLIINNPSYRVLTTLGERKAAFTEWSRAKQAAAEEARQKEQRQRKVDFVNMLKECAELTSRTRFSKVLSLFASDSRWLALDDGLELEREELFEEYTLSLDRKEEAERRSMRKERMGALRSLYERSGVVVASSWRRVQQQLEGDPAFRAVDKIDRLRVFEDMVRDAEQREDQERHASKEETRAAERRKRDAFRALLLRKHHEGLITPRSRWRDVVGELSVTSEYRGAVEQPGSTPAELFEDVVETLNDEYAAHRRRIRACVHAGAGFAFTAETSLDALERALHADPSAAGVPQWAAQEFLREQLERIARDAAEEGRRAQRARRSLIELYAAALRHALGDAIAAETTWEQAEEAFSGKEEREGGKPAAIGAMVEAEQRATFSLALAAAISGGAGDDASEKRSKRERGERGERGERERGRERDRDRDRRRDGESEDDESRRKRHKRKHHHHERAADGAAAADEREEGEADGLETGAPSAPPEARPAADADVSAAPPGPATAV